MALDEWMLDAEDQAQDLGGVLRFEKLDDDRFEITKMRLPRWDGERSEFFNLLSALSDQTQTALIIDPEQAIQAGDRKIALSSLEKAEFVKDSLVTEGGVSEGKLVRLPNPIPVYNPDPVF